MADPQPLDPELEPEQIRGRDDQTRKPDEPTSLREAGSKENQKMERPEDDHRTGDSGDVDGAAKLENATPSLLEVNTSTLLSGPQDYQQPSSVSFAHNISVDTSGAALQQSPTGRYKSTPKDVGEETGRQSQPYAEQRQQSSGVIIDSRENVRSEYEDAAKSAQDKDFDQRRYGKGEDSEMIPGRLEFSAGAYQADDYRHGEVGRKAFGHQDEAGNFGEQGRQLFDGSMVAEPDVNQVVDASDGAEFIPGVDDLPIFANDQSKALNNEIKVREELIGKTRLAIGFGEQRRSFVVYPAFCISTVACHIIHPNS